MEEVNKLPNFVLLLVLMGLILGIGILVLDKFGTATAYETTYTDSLTIPAEVDGTANLSRSPINSFTSITNSSGNTLDSSNYTVNLTSGVITFTANMTEDTTCPSASTCTATYLDTKTDTNSFEALNDTVTAIKEIPSTWLSLIVTIIVLALILTIVTRSFVLNRQ